MDYTKQTKEFNRNSHLVKPTKTHPKGNQFTCNQCDRSFTSISKLRFHQRSHNQDKHNQSQATNHKRTLHEGKTFHNNQDRPSIKCLQYNDR